MGNRLDRPVDGKSDHILGPPDAPITLVEYGSYACPYCRAANERIAEVRDRDLADQSSRAVGNPKFGVGDSFPRSPAKARRPSGIDPADH